MAVQLRSYGEYFPSIRVVRELSFLDSRRKGQETMRLHLLTLGIAGFLFAGNPAYAQGVGGTVEISRSGDPREMAQYVRSALEEMMTGLKAVSKLADAARREGDDEMVQCVQARLSNIRALLMVSERANGAMKEAVGSANVQRAEHEFRKVVVSLAKVRQFTAEADGCMGDAGTTPGTSEVQVSQSGLTVGDDSQALDNYSMVVGVEPPDVTPFQ